MRNNYEIWKELCIHAVKTFVHILDELEKELDFYRELCIVAVMKNGLNLKNLDESFRKDREICLIAVTQNREALNYVFERTPELINAANAAGK